MRIASLLLGLLAVSVSAQPMDPFDFEMASVILLQDKAVQKHLKVTEGQRSGMNKFADTHRGKMDAYRVQLEKAQKDKNKPLPVDARKMDQMFLDMKQGVLRLLTPVQLKRLREISLQQVGFMALTDPKVGKRVGLTAAETKKISATYEAGMKEAEDIARAAQAQLNVQLAEMRKKKPKDAKEEEALMKEAQKKAQALEARIDPQIEKVRLGTRKKVLDGLTPKQRQAWNALLGAPFRG